MSNEAIEYLRINRIYTKNKAIAPHLLILLTRWRN